MLGLEHLFGSLISSIPSQNQSRQSDQWSEVVVGGDDERVKPSVSLKSDPWNLQF